MSRTHVRCRARTILQLLTTTLCLLMLPALFLAAAASASAQANPVIASVSNPAFAGAEELKAPSPKFAATGQLAMAMGTGGTVSMIIPEPSTMALLGIGLGLLVARRQGQNGRCA